MKNYYRVMLGRKSAYAEEAYKGNFIGAGFIKDRDLTNHLSNNWRDFNEEFIPIFLEQNPGKTKVSAGLACGMLWTIIKGIQVDDIVLCSDGKGNYYVGEVTGNYGYHRGEALPTVELCGGSQKQSHVMKWVNHYVILLALSEQ